MKHAMMFAVAFTCIACGGSTGSNLVTFAAAASGPVDADGGPMTFLAGSGALVTLTQATLTVGAIYLNQAVPLSGSASSACISPGIYVGQAFGPVSVDLLSANAIPFPTIGEGTQTLAKTAEVWLAVGDVNAQESATAIFSMRGVATQDAGTFPFAATVSIGSNRSIPTSNPALPSANAICHQRIVSPIAVEVTPRDGATLVLRIDPRGMLNNIDFTSLGMGADGTFVIPDKNVGAGRELLRGLRATSGVYSFEFLNEDR